MSSVIGMDLGGTNLRAAQVHSTGEVRTTRQVSVDHSAHRNNPSSPPFHQLTSMLAEMVDDVNDDDEVVGIGVSVTGPVDPVTGWVENPYTLPASMQGDLIGAICSEFDVPVAIENDANAAALGEAIFGAGRGGDLVVCVTIGTGIGVGVVEHGRLYEGAGRAHPEAGHLVVDPTGPACYCGASGCIESLASATAIVRAAMAVGVLPDGASAHDVHLLASGGNADAQQIVDRAVSSLAAGIRNLVAVYAPDIVVLAGNARGDPTRLVQVVSDAVNQFPFGAPSVAVRNAALGNWAGCLGAATLLKV